jgi:hypothetical protein
MLVGNPKGGDNVKGKKNAGNPRVKGYTRKKSAGSSKRVRVPGYYRKARRNPGLGKIANMVDLNQVAFGTAGFVGGLWAASQLKATGWFKYLAVGGTGLAMGLIGKDLLGKKNAQGFMIGSLLAVGVMIVNDKIWPGGVSSRLTGIGQDLLEDELLEGTAGVGQTYPKWKPIGQADEDELDLLALDGTAGVGQTYPEWKPIGETASEMEAEFNEREAGR